MREMTYLFYKDFLLFFCHRYSDIVRDVRPNKGTILKSSVDFIKILKTDVERLRTVESSHQRLEAQNRKLLLRIQVNTTTLFYIQISVVKVLTAVMAFQELELQAKAHGLPITSSSSWDVPENDPILNGYLPSDEPPPPSEARVRFLRKKNKKLPKQNDRIQIFRFDLLFLSAIFTPKGSIR